jgi:hypothetical protein
MGLESHPRCDVFREQWGEAVKEYQIIIKEVVKDGAATVDQEIQQAYLSPRALARFKTFRDRGLAPPSKRAVKPK